MNICLIGAGNLGFHLGLALGGNNLQILQVFSRSSKKAKELAVLVGAKSITNLNQLTTQAQLYILAVSDAALPTVIKDIAGKLPAEAFVVHTSGATPKSVFSNYFKHYGVFYPLQTFSKKRKVSFENIPICIDATDEIYLKKLEEIGRRISTNVVPINDQQRATLHLAAVFVNNFSNHLFHIGQQITQQDQVPFDLLLPLIKETVEKLKGHLPIDMQTGPAIRSDQITINRHLQQLDQHPLLFQEIYKLLTRSINPNFKDL